MADAVADILRKVAVPDTVRAQAWDAFASAKDQDDLAAKLRTIGLPQSVKADLWDLKAQAAAVPASAPAQPAQGDGMIEGVAKGVAKSALGTIEGLGNVVRSIPVVGPLLSKGPEVTLPISTKPSNTSQAVGKAVGDVAQFFVPGMATGGRLAQAAKAAGLTYAQTGGDATASGLSAGLTAVLPGAGVASRASGALEQSAEKSVARALGATKEWAKTEAAKLAPEVIKRGIGGSRQAMLGIAEEASKRVGADLNAAIATAADAGETISGTAIRDGLKTIADTFFVAKPDGARLAIPGTEQVIRRLASLDRFVADLGSDIPIDKAVAVRRVWDKIVDDAGLFGRKGVASGADNAGAFATKQASDAFRTLINESPSLDALNKESSFWQGLTSVLNETIARTQSQSSGLSQAIQSGAGATVGGMFGENAGDRFKNAVLGGIAGRQVVRVLQSPAFATKVSAPMKNMLAHALASGSAARIESAARAVIQSLPSQVRQATAGDSQ
jgi:hypothetical protein